MTKFKSFTAEAMVTIKSKHTLRLVDLFNNLKDFNYALVKTETPYMPEGFPKIYPIGKDLDILCSESDFNKINTTLLTFAKQYRFRLKIVRNEVFYRVRMIHLFKLHYQLDNSFKLEFNNSNAFVEKAIKNRIAKDDYYILETKYELIIRMFEVIKNPQKLHHLDYIKKHIADIDKSLFPSEEFYEIYNKLTK